MPLIKLVIILVETLICLLPFLVPQGKDVAKEPDVPPPAAPAVEDVPTMPIRLRIHNTGVGSLPFGAWLVFRDRPLSIDNICVFKQHGAWCLACYRVRGGYIPDAVVWGPTGPRYQRSRSGGQQVRTGRIPVEQLAWLLP